MRPRWEYSILQLTGDDAEDVRWLAGVGEVGWQVVGVVQQLSRAGPTVYLMRQMEEAR
jgi:hypothetical protein